MRWECPTIHLADVITEPAGNPNNVGSRCGSFIEFFFQPVLLRLRYIVFINAVKVVVSPVMVNIITAKISVFIHIPCGVVIVGIKAVADVSAFNSGGS